MDDMGKIVASAIAMGFVALLGGGGIGFSLGDDAMREGPQWVALNNATGEHIERLQEHVDELERELDACDAELDALDFEEDINDE